MAVAVGALDARSWSPQAARPAISREQGEVLVRPVNDERIAIEYTRIHRVVESADLFRDLQTEFGEDLAGRLATAVGLYGRWWGKQWRIGNVDVRRDGADSVISISFQFGWYGEAPTVDAPPPYDEASHQWAAEPATRREGVLALLAVDVTSQFAAVTSLAGNVPVPGMCRALSDLLNQTEIQERYVAGARPSQDWLVEPVDERGTFEAWVERMAKVTRVSARFHLPNPRTSDDIAPAVNFLNELGAINGSAVASNPDGLDPYGHPLMQGAIAMQENDYGSITASGETEAGDADKFRSKEHPTQDRYDLMDEENQLSLAGVVSVLLRYLSQRVQQGMR